MIFRVVLWVMGVLLWIASRTSRRLRAQLARDMTVVIGAKDGVARSFVVKNRQISSHLGRASNAACSVTFKTAAQGARILVAADAIGQIVDGLASRDIEVQGQAAVVLWFYELTMAFAPGRKRRSQVMPDAYVAHDPDAKAANRISREPAVRALDPACTAAVAQREKLLIWQVGRGATPEGRFTNHKIVVEVPDSAVGEGG